MGALLSKVPWATVGRVLVNTSLTLVTEVIKIKNDKLKAKQMAEEIMKNMKA